MCLRLRCFGRSRSHLGGDCGICFLCRDRQWGRSSLADRNAVAANVAELGIVHAFALGVRIIRLLVVVIAMHTSCTAAGTMRSPDTQLARR